MSEITIRAKSALKVTDGVNNVDFMADKGVIFSDFISRLPGITGLDKQLKQLQSKIAALSIAVADNDIDEVKRLLPLSGEQVVREIQAEAVEKTLDEVAWYHDRNFVKIDDLLQYANQLRNPEQEKV